MREPSWRIDQASLSGWLLILHPSRERYLHRRGALPVRGVRRLDHGDLAVSTPSLHNTGESNR